MNVHQKSRLNRLILDQGRTEFRRQLDYTLEDSCTTPLTTNPVGPIREAD